MDLADKIYRYCNGFIIGLLTAYIKFVGFNFYAGLILFFILLSILVDLVYTKNN